MLQDSASEQIFVWMRAQGQPDDARVASFGVPEPA